MNDIRPPVTAHACCAATSADDSHTSGAARAMRGDHGHEGHRHEGPASVAARAHHAHHAHIGSGVSLPGLTTAATLHCLTGCAIGEWIGLAIGVTLGLDPWTTMALATALGFVSGYALGLWPLVKQGMGWLPAFKTLWLGETISIAVMELAMNATDYMVGGVQAGSVLSLRFWLGFALALPAGFIVAWPVNWWLLRANVKAKCH